MNYIREINAFYDWLEVNSISDSCIVLWHALMNICNKAGWITEFSVAVSTLEVKTGLKKDAINRARQRLKQVGRIDFRSRTGQQSAIYRIISFESQNATQNYNFDNCDVLNDTNRVTNRAQTASQSATQTASQSATQTASIIKLNETMDQEEKRARDHLCDTEFAEVINFFNHNIHPICGTESEDLGAWMDEGMPAAVIIMALKEAVRANARNMKYINATLRNWADQGLKTPESVEAYLRDWKDKQNQRKGSDSAGRIQNGGKPGTRPPTYVSEYPAGGFG